MCQDFFLAEAYGQATSPELRARIHESLKLAVACTTRAQSDLGGWYYLPYGNQDEGSVTVTQIQGLRAARNAGIDVDYKVIDKAVGYIRKSANPDGGIRYMAGQSGGGSRPAITAAAVAVLYNAGRYDDPMAEKAERAGYEWIGAGPDALKRKMTEEKAQSEEVIRFAGIKPR